MKNSMISIHSTTHDKVIKSSVASGMANYAYALENLFPLLNRFGEQRKIQNRKFYSRLRSDIITGCVMPPITLAFENNKLSNGESIKEIEEFVNKNIEKGYVLDGLQRLTTLNDASHDENFDSSRSIFLNVIIAKRYDLLLYRMITLNNGQKPMTARHQVEMLTGPLLQNLSLDNLSIEVLSEKETEGKRVSGAFKRADVIEAYTAYLSNNVHNQNSKIIEDRLDDIIVGRVMDSGLTNAKFSFKDILLQINRLARDQGSKDWLRQKNNLIGFTVGAKNSLDTIKELSPEDFSSCIKNFEEAFSAINRSKVNLGRFRRDLSEFYIRKIENFVAADVEDIESCFFEETM